MNLFTSHFSTPLGLMQATVDPEGRLLRLAFLESEAGAKLDTPKPGPCAAVIAQLEEYFAGRRRDFDLPLAPEGTEFQRRVWEALQRIPWGSTISYSQLAERLGDPKAVRAVAGANAANPICIVIPCHRVLGASGALTGYAYGLERKRALLSLEGLFKPNNRDQIDDK